ncbi:MAG: hypothetical protein AMXMBFR34_26050 [Myxococcaceae bacterium]
MREVRWVLLGLAVVGCQRPPLPAPPPPAPAVMVPEGCLADLSGAWVHSVDPSFRYQGVDDGGTLTLTVVRVEPPGAHFRPRRFRDAGTSPSDGGSFDAGPADEVPDAGQSAVHLVLDRTAHGFVGQTRLSVHHPQGKDCDAVFPAEVVDCRDGGLVIAATAQVSFAGDCRLPPQIPSGPPPRHALRRP